MATHAVIGTGVGVAATNSAIFDALKDTLNEGDSIVVPWFGGQPAPGLKSVYDFVLDKKVPFVMVYTDRVARTFAESEFGVVQKVDSIPDALALEITSDGMGLVIGTDETTDEMIEAFWAKANEPRMADMGDGLTPITVMGGPSEPVEAEPTREVDEDTPSALNFSKEELLEMHPRALARIAQTVLDEVPADVEDIVAEIEALREPTEVVDEEPMPEEVATAVEALRERGGEDLSNEAQQYCMKFDDLLHSLRHFVKEHGQDMVKDGSGMDPRHLSIVKTKLDEVALWYHYGPDVS